MEAFDKSSEWLLRAAVLSLGNTPEAKDWIERVYKVGRCDGAIEANRESIGRLKAKIAAKEAA